jgi:hypothetical protein
MHPAKHVIVSADRDSFALKQNGVICRQLVVFGGASSVQLRYSSIREVGA